MATTEIKVPDIGDFDGVEIIEIHVEPGARIAVEDPLITLESDKAAMDVPAPQAGVVKEVKVAMGETVSEGSVILLLEADDDGDAKAPEADAPEAEAPKAAQETKPAEAPAANAPSAAEAPATPVAAAPSGPLPDFSRVHASPVVRALAREHGIDLNNVAPTGKNGRVTKDDVQRAIRGGAPAAAAGAAPAEPGVMGIPPIPAVDFSQFGETETVELSRIKRLTAQNLHRAWLNIPHVTHHDEADITDLEAFRQALKPRAEAAGVRVTLLSFFMKALAATLREFPTFNASLAPDGQSLILKKYIHIGIAVDTPNGLVVPVIRDVDKKGIFELSGDLAEISAKARDKKLRPNDLQGGTMSISSLGGIGGTAFTPIVNAPEVAILGLARSKMQPQPKGDSFEFRLMQPMSLSYDHRVIDGAEAARFVKHLGQLAADTRLLLL